MEQEEVVAIADGDTAEIRGYSGYEDIAAGL